MRKRHKNGKKLKKIPKTQKDLKKAISHKPNQGTNSKI